MLRVALTTVQDEHFNHTVESCDSPICCPCPSLNRADPSVANLLVPGGFAALEMLALPCSRADQLADRLDVPTPQRHRKNRVQPLDRVEDQ